MFSLKSYLVATLITILAITYSGCDKDEREEQETQQCVSLASDAGPQEADCAEAGSEAGSSESGEEVEAGDVESGPEHGLRAGRAAG